MHTRPIRFHHRGDVVEVPGDEPTRTVLQWLREDAHCSGTKEGCAEGDCGACTVVLGELAGDGEAAPRLRLRSTNACIRFLPTLDGKALFTVEDLKRLNGGRLHPVQEALVECHGSQCGFCTPGFVMSLWPLYEKHRRGGTRPSRQQLADGLSGNLCRCTGYRPILDAGERMFDLPAAEFDTAALIAALQQLRAQPPLRLDGRFHAPRTLDELAALCAARPQALILAGATDIGLWVTKQLRDLGELIYTGEVSEMRQITRHEGRLRIGAAASLEDAFGALAAHWPALQDVWLRFASPPIRHAGTLGGNLANGSPIGDAAPVLMALDARIVLRLAERVRALPLREFYLDYMKNRLEPGEFVLSIELPLPREGQAVRAYKVSKRFDSDISAVCAGLAIELDGERVAAVRFAYGGMAATVRHAERAEAAVRGQPWTQATLQAAMQALQDDFTPLSDMRASAGYRLQVARNLLHRFWLETRAADALGADEVGVWGALAAGRVLLPLPHQWERAGGEGALQPGPVRLPIR